MRTADAQQCDTSPSAEGLHIRTLFSV